MGLACRFWKERRVQGVCISAIHNINAIRGNNLCTLARLAARAGEFGSVKQPGSAVVAMSF